MICKPTVHQRLNKYATVIHKVVDEEACLFLTQYVRFGLHELREMTNLREQGLLVNNMYDEHRNDY